MGVTLTGVGSTEIAHRTVDDAQTVKAIEKFADSYNKVLSFLNKYKDKSSALNNMAYSYGTTRLFSGILSEIGINVDSKGNLSVDEGRLRDALQNNRDEVERVLGGPGGLDYDTYAKTQSIIIRQKSQSLYPKPQALASFNYLYGRNRTYVNAYTSGMFFSSLI